MRVVLSITERQDKMKNYNKYELYAEESRVWDSDYDYNARNHEAVYKFATEILKLDKADREIFGVLCLNSQLDIIGYNEASKGNLTSTLATPREIFKLAIMQNAYAIIALHQHPSGDSTPSEADLKTTRSLVKAGKLLEIPLLDHLVIGHNSYFSFAEEGLI